MLQKNINIKEIFILPYHIYALITCYIAIVALASLTDSLIYGSKFIGTSRSAGDLKICIDITPTFGYLSIKQKI